ncbi:hypothetical protein TNCT_689711 [Trichonephila clavata]|uniref:Uncharacterized protein n=1 Tax=Trichonephila clavata TaxID=2740835 RepID=A0A8X6HG17_TRICU|nr:hypothetical protein TNCT_689711 [Trichonephila clavata]
MPSDLPLSCCPDRAQPMLHKKSVAQNTSTSAPKPKDCRWCADCNNYIPESISMADHIARRHNVKKAIDSRDKMHTELVGILPENITDASVPHGTATFSIASTAAPALKCQYCEAFVQVACSTAFTHKLAPTGRTTPQRGIEGGQRLCPKNF